MHNYQNAIIAAAAMMQKADSAFFRTPVAHRMEKPLLKCGLPGCGVFSVKQYCCAEHCRDHRAQQIKAK